MAEKIKIKGHEKFVLREGWIDKGITAIGANSRIFLESNAPEELGVGSNMVKSIRYWLKAFALMEEIPGKGADLSELGKLIKKYDEYLQNKFTLWILHSQIVKNIRQATTWHFFFNFLEIEDFTKTQIAQLMVYELEKFTGQEMTKSSVIDDVTTLLSMYCRQKSLSYDPEEKNISPLAELGLVLQTKDKYAKKQPDLSLLSEWVILYELSDVFKRTTSTSVSIDALYEETNSIGKIYNLSRVALNDYLDKLASMSYIRVDRTAGLDMVYKQFDEEPIKIIEQYYQGHK